MPFKFLKTEEAAASQLATKVVAKPAVKQVPATQDTVLQKRKAEAPLKVPKSGKRSAPPLKRAKVETPKKQAPVTPLKKEEPKKSGKKSEPVTPMREKKAEP